MKTVVGNGQSGRITLLERAVERLQEWRWWIVDAAGGASRIVSLVAWAVKR